MSLVRECRIVTVAFACSNNFDTVDQQYGYGPITTAFLPSKSISACLRISIMPSGVHGTKVCSSIYNLPIFEGWKPSTSFFRINRF